MAKTALRSVPLDFSELDEGSWWNEPNEQCPLSFQISSRHSAYIQAALRQRGFDLLIEAPEKKGTYTKPEEPRFVGWFKSLAAAKKKAEILAAQKMTWEKAVKRFGPFNKSNKAIKDKPYKSKKTAKR